MTLRRIPRTRGDEPKPEGPRKTITKRVPSTGGDEPGDWELVYTTMKHSPHTPGLNCDPGNPGRLSAAFPVHAGI